MKDLFKNKYVAWGLTAFSVLVGIIIIFFSFYRINYIIAFFDKIFRLLSPLIYGLVLAYILNPLVKFLDQKVFSKIIKSKKKKLTRSLALTATTIIFIGIIVASISFLIPEVIKSIEMLISNFDIYLENSKTFLLSIFSKRESISAFIVNNYDSINKFVNNWLNEGFLNDIVVHVSNSIWGIVLFVYNLIVGYIISVYILYDKEKFKAQTKKLLYTIFDVERVNVIVDNIRYTDRVFLDFFVGKLIDSLIVGIICFICLAIFDMPYALLIAIIVGITNIIPYFGPFIGAVPSAVLIFVVSPSKVIGFIIFITVLQQIDGNILGPKILGSKTGLSSFWVLLSLLIFGGLFGIIGMIIGVPILSILYSFVNGLAKKRLSSKKLPTESKDYENLKYINAKGKPVYNK
jgi:predicted PurR-regulated permease PerM